jgi:hypothetical protein
MQSPVFFAELQRRTFAQGCCFFAIAVVMSAFITLNTREGKHL